MGDDEENRVALDFSGRIAGFGLGHDVADRRVWGLVGLGRPIGKNSKGDGFSTSGAARHANRQCQEGQPAQSPQWNHVYLHSLNN